MIKRLKWNVLFGESIDDDSDLSDGSDDSAEGGSADVQAALDQLVRNDPDLAEELHVWTEASSSGEEDEEHATNHVAEDAKPPDVFDEVDEHESIEYAEWRECELCPGKRFLNDEEVECHLESKCHARAVRRIAARSTTEDNHDTPKIVDDIIDDDSLVPEAIDNPTQNGDVENHTNSDTARKHGDVPLGANLEVKGLTANDEEGRQNSDQLNCNPGREITEDERRRTEKRKAAVKRRLKALKRRKWEKKQKMEKEKECIEHRQASQQPDTWDDGKEPGIQPVQHMKKSGKSRKRQRDKCVIIERGQDTDNAEVDLPLRGRNKKTSKKKLVDDSSRTPREDRKRKRRKTGQSIPTDDAERIRKKRNR